MDERLLGIVHDQVILSRCIDVLALSSMTKYSSFERFGDICWDMVRHLHILVEDGFTHIERLTLSQGIYISVDGSWVLLFGEPPAEEQEVVNYCSEKLELLNIMSRCINGLDLREAKQLRNLRVYAPRFLTYSAVVEGIDNLKKLESIALRNVKCRRDLDLSGQTELRHLKIIGDYSSPKQTISGLQSLLQLEHLDLWRTKWEDGIDLSRLSNLNHLSLWDGDVDPGRRNRIYGISELRNLQSLRLRGNQVEDLVDLKSLQRLRALYLLNSRNSTVLNQIDHLQELEVLDISGSAIRKIPEGLRSLKRLKHVDLSNLHLASLPSWLPELGLPISQKNRTAGIDLHGTSVVGVNMSIFDQSEDVILEWFRSNQNEDTVPLQELKVVFLGDGEAGKTYTIARLLNDGGEPRQEHFDDKATPGIVIRDKVYELDGREVKVHFWDFGGQEILHSMHRMFLTERTLYVVLINARDDTQDDRARYWLNNIKSFADGSPVLLVLNKIDQNPNASINEPELRELYGNLRRVVRLSALEYSRERFSEAFTGALLEEMRSFESLGTLWPASWAKLKTGLETMQDNYITGVDYMQMCADSGVEKNEKELLRWFNDLGVSFYYEGSHRLEHYVILRPEWITNGIYILLFNRSGAARNGVVPMNAIYEMLCPRGEDGYRRVRADYRYDVNEADYVLEVMRKFRLSYSIKGREEFIPALCQRESMPVAKEYADDPDALEFRMTYDYLPDNVIHRLMVEMRSDLQLSDVWRTGALLKQPGTGLSAVVKSEGDLLRIFVRSDNDLHRPNTYLCILKENIDRINRDMKLAPPFAEVVYKTERGSECFDYEDLLNAQKDGEETYRSKLLRRRVPIQDILNQTGREAEMELERLRDAIVTACLQMQQNRSFWTANEESRIEDERNTYLRDMLINFGYLVSDQHLQGLGSGGRGYGELDMDIRREASIPWTILEALRIKDGTKRDWNSHLKKLLDNYNPSGMRHLFLLTYVDCGKDDFEGILSGFAEHIRWHDEGDYGRLPGTFTHLPMRRHGDPAYLRVMRCAYDRAGAPTTVTHIFVRIGE